MVVSMLSTSARRWLSGYLTSVARLSFVPLHWNPSVISIQSRSVGATIAAMIACIGCNRRLLVQEQIDSERSCDETCMGLGAVNCQLQDAGMATPLGLCNALAESYSCRVQARRGLKDSPCQLQGSFLPSPYRRAHGPRALRLGGSSV